MSQSPNSGAINIIHPDDINYCKNKCSLTYNFLPEQDIIIQNMGSYLSIDIKDTNRTPVTYNSTSSDLCPTGGEAKYTLNEIRIYAAKNSSTTLGAQKGGSLHTYDGKHTIGEVIIKLTKITGSGDLLICIPISAVGGILPEATKELSNIIQKCCPTANCKGGMTCPSQGISLDLNSFIPKNKGFYSYTAGLPWPRDSNISDACTNYVVYNPPNSINLSLKDINTLTQLINPSNITINSTINISNINYAYNQGGAIFTLDSSDVTVFDCNPIGDDGQVLMNQTKDGKPFNPFSLSDETRDNIMKILPTILGVLASILGLLIMIGVGWWAFKRRTKGGSIRTNKTNGIESTSS